MSEDVTLDDFRQENKDSISSEDWQERELSEVAQITMGSSPKSEYYNEDGDGLPFFQSNDEFGFRHPEHDRWCSNPQKIAQSGDLLMTIRGTYVGQMNLADRESCIGRGLAGITPSEQVNGEFLFQQLNYIEPYIKSIAIGSTFVSISSAEIDSLEIDVPPLSEQRKIATIIYTVERAIEKTEDTIDRLNRIQKGTLRDLFENGIKTGAETQDSPMGRFPKHWELKPMQKVGSLINGNAFPKEYQGVPEGEYPFIKVSDTNDYRRFVTGAKNHISKEIADEIGCNIQPEGTVILPKRGAAIMTNKRRILAQESAIDNNQIGIVGKEVQPLFLYYYLSDVDMGRFVQDGAVKSLTKSLLSKIRVPVPSPETQSKIVETLESIDERIESEKQVKTQQERLKHGLMQDLLSGTVRTTDTNIEVPEEIAHYG